ncbi:MerR family DNA-binding transcriptional regulator [Ralstonia solanacearum]|nr:MerR family DNA-binding transcriptional regulator [Ralstonia solanacearum]
MRANFYAPAMTTFLTIRQATEATGRSTHTLRYYERIGLLDSIERRGNGHRVFRAADMAWLAFQLKVHIEAGLNVGLTREAITETILPMALYAGFPAALNGMFAAKAVFADQDAAGEAGASTRRDTSN